MSSFSVENGKVLMDVKDLDAHTRELAEFAVDIMTPFAMTRPARADEQGIIERPLAADVSPAYQQVVAELAMRGVESQSY
jgi:hypothetical protein